MLQEGRSTTRDCGHFDKNRRVQRLANSLAVRDGRPVDFRQPFSTTRTLGANSITSGPVLGYVGVVQSSNGTMSVAQYARYCAHTLLLPNILIRQPGRGYVQIRLCDIF